MSNPVTTFKLLEDCNLRDLIRINLGTSTEWALVSTKTRDLLVVVVLSGKSAPYSCNAMGGMGVKDEFADPVLYYGHDYTFAPDHTGPCDVKSGQLFGANGSLLLSEVRSAPSFFLCCDFPEQGKKTYYDINTGSLSGEPGGQKASFGRWSLWLNNTGMGEGTLIRLIEFSCSL
jgi:hypothetical protein